MTIIIKAIVLGILTGGVYALMASGLTLIFGVMKIVNIAQAILVMLGAYLSYTVERYLHLDIFVSLLITETCAGSPVPSGRGGMHTSVRITVAISPMDRTEKSRC